jgi:alpha-galactosidase
MALKQLNVLVAGVGGLGCPLILFLIGYLFVGCTNKPTPVFLPNGLAQTPPMGWNSWNAFQTGVSDALLRQMADAMVTNGMKDAGYQYVNIDDGWALPKRLNGHIQPDPAKFPNGFKPVSDYLHARGLKFGIYSDRGTLTCVRKCPGSYGHETIDANDFAAWGVDYLKYDNCNPVMFSNQEKDYRRMRAALAATGRPIVFSICAWEFKDWMPETGELWRTTNDITDNWDNIVGIIDLNQRWAKQAGPGKWNDPDMLVVGCYGIPDLQHNQTLDGKSDLVGAKGLTDEEYRSHFSLWAMMAAPLIAGNDVRNMPENIRTILLNREVIAIDQDPLGRQCVEVRRDGNGTSVYSKELKGNNTRAVALFNRSKTSEKIAVRWVDIGIPAGTAKVRDLWKHKDLGVFKDGYEEFVPPHGVVLLQVSGTTRGAAL